MNDAGLAGPIELSRDVAVRGFAPRAAVLVSTLFWGTLWIPLRQLGSDASGAKPLTAVAFLIPLLVMLPFGVVRWRSIAAGGWPLVQAGFLMAASVALYAEALRRGDVARVILLFYLTPVWSTLLAWKVLGVAISSPRIVTIGLGLSGMLIVFAPGREGLAPGTGGDGMGLVAGMLWAGSLVQLRRLEADMPEFEKVFMQFLFLGVLFCCFSLVPGGPAWAMPSTVALVDHAGWLLALGLIWMPVVIWLTMFGASRLEPGLVALLLMLEVVVGLASAACLAGEPFGARELAGATFILAACASEYFVRV